MTLVPPGTVVLVVDDDVEVRHSVADLLILEGYDARPLPSADAAWSELSLGVRPSLIILDLWIQGMTSSEFLRRLRASPYARAPVLVLSGSPSRDHVEWNVRAVLHKPIEATALVRAVDRLATRPTPGADRDAYDRAMPPAQPLPRSALPRPARPSSARGRALARPRPRTR
jgi:DNA-binding response OmpR family regulator